MMARIYEDKVRVSVLDFCVALTHNEWNCVIKISKCICDSFQQEFKSGGGSGKDLQGGWC